jgi:hypothetical protein
MTEKKLTARLSDGTEWEVVGDKVYQSKAARGEHVIWLKPLKLSPPPKEIWVPWYGSRGLGGSYASKDEAPPDTDCRSTHRYVLAEEAEGGDRQPSQYCRKCGLSFAYTAITEAYAPEVCKSCWKSEQKKPQPREWWIVYDDKLGIHHMFAHEASARLFHEVDKRERDTPFRVREVLDEGSADKSRVYHLQFRRNGQLLRVLGPVEKGKAALLFEDQEHKDEYAHEVVRVRQSRL